MKSKSSFVIAYWWLLMMFVFGLALLLFAEKEERMSDSEKRMLSGFPEISAESVLSGEFSSGFESYLSDGVFGRDSIVGVSESVLRLFDAGTAEDAALLDGLEMDAQLQGVDSNTQQTDETGSERTDAPEDSGKPAVSNADAALPEQETDASGINGYGLWAEYAQGGYHSLHTITESQIENVATAVNSFKEFLPEDGCVFYTNVPLTQVGNIIRRDDRYSGWHENVEECFAKHAGTNVHYINAPQLMEDDLLAGSHVYFSSDHHWTPRGAIKVVNECMRIQGVPTVPYDEYSYRTLLFTNTELHTQDDLELMEPLLNVRGYRMSGGEQGEECRLIEYGLDNYAAYLGGDYKAWTKYVTGFSTGRRALVIGDSFSNAFTPYLVPYYDEVHKLDPRYHDETFNGGSVGKLMQKYGIDDVYIILSYANGITSKTSMDKLEIILYGNS